MKRPARTHALLVLLIAIALASCQGPTPTKVTVVKPTADQSAPAKPTADKPAPPSPTTENPEPGQPTPEKPALTQEPSAGNLPNFIYTVRAYGGGGYEEFQYQTMNELGLHYVQGLVDFSWPHVERGDNVWKWSATDEQMDAVAQAGLKVIAFLMCPKSPGLPWDESITRGDPRFVAQYEEFAYNVVERYHDHPAWSGLVAVWGGSADVWEQGYPATDPEVVVPLLNAAYSGIKRADPQSIVIGFNFATTAGLVPEQWEEYHERAFALNPQFDWYGVQSHSVPVTLLESPDSYAGVAGLPNLRRFLDEHGYADKPIWGNEGGFGCGEDGLPEQVHAEEVVETFIVVRTLGVNMKGWVYFDYFAKEHFFEGAFADFGLMTPLDQSDPPQPRMAWTALQTLIRTVGFFDYEFEEKLSGEFNETAPFVYRFARPDRPASRLWVVFSPWVTKSEPVVQDVTISIAPATEATLIDMLGQRTTLTADGAGNIIVTSTEAPVYVSVGDW